MSLDGFINVDKPAGKTSFGVVARIKRLSGEKRVGHLGTLDPFATGVLPLCLGRATRLARYLADGRKAYLARICLGIATETYDGEGAVTNRADTANITAEQVANILSRLRGTILQVPPVYSALKYKGERMCDLTRAGVHVQPEARKVTIFALSLASFQLPFATFTVECSKGTYIRSLAHDIGMQLGCGAYLAQLTRTASGPFSIDDALGLDEIGNIFERGEFDKILIPPDRPLTAMGTVTLDACQESAVKTGVSIRLESYRKVTADLCRAYSKEGTLTAILRYKQVQDLWHPETVLAQEANSI